MYATLPWKRDVHEAEEQGTKQAIGVAFGTHLKSILFLSSPEPIANALYLLFRRSRPDPDPIPSRAWTWPMAELVRCLQCHGTTGTILAYCAKVQVYIASSHLFWKALFSKSLSKIGPPYILDIRMKLI